MIKVPCEECITYATCKHKPSLFCKPLYTYLKQYGSKNAWHQMVRLFDVDQNPKYVHDDFVYECFILFYPTDTEGQETNLHVLSDGARGMTVEYTDEKVKDEDAIWSWFVSSGGDDPYGGDE